MSTLQNFLQDPGHKELLAENVLMLQDEISRFLFISDPPRPVDLCVVLGAPSFSNVDPAIALYQSGLVQHIVITGFGPKQTQSAENHLPEYAGLRQRALSAGIPPEVIHVEELASNTLENFVNSARLIESRLGWETISRVAITGKPLHMRRALMTARVHWPSHVELLMQPTSSPTDLQADTWYRHESGRVRVLNELNSIVKYSSKGDIRGV